MTEMEIQCNYRRRADGVINGTHRILPNTPELCTILNAILSWRLRELVDFAIQRHGFGNSDGGSGVIYPDDMDASDIAEIGSISEGQVIVYRFWGPPDGEQYVVPESLSDIEQVQNEKKPFTLR